MKNKFEQQHLITILYQINSFETIKTFLLINKRCTETSFLYNHFTKQKEIPKNLLTFFPNLKTISCDLEDVIQNKSLFQHIQNIHLTIDCYFCFQLEKKSPLESIDISIRNKIVSIKTEDPDLHCITIPFIQLLPNCKRIITFASDFNYFFEKNKNLKLNEFICILSKVKNNELNKFKEYLKTHSIQRKVCYLNEVDMEMTQIEKEKMRKELQTVFDYVYTNTIYRCEPIEYYPLNSTFIDLNELQHNIIKFNSYGSSVRKDPFQPLSNQLNVMRIDLRKYTKLEKIKWMSNEYECCSRSDYWLPIGNPRILFDNWKNIKEIENIPSMDVLPNDISSIKRIQFNETKFKFEIIFKENKVIISEYITDEYCEINEDKTLLMNLWKLSKKKYDEIEYHLTLGDYNTVVDCDVPSFTYYNALLIAESTPMIPKKFIHIICEKNQPFNNIYNRFKNNKSITFKLDIVTQWGYIDDIPKDEKLLKFHCKILKPKYISNKNVYNQIESIECENEVRDREESFVDFTGFINCKKFVYKGISFEQFDTHQILFPPNIEELEFELQGGDESYLQLLNITKLTKLKRFICLSDLTKFEGINLPNNHFEYVKVSSDCKIVNKKKLKIDTFEIEQQENKYQNYNNYNNFDNDDYF